MAQNTDDFNSFINAVRQEVNNNYNRTKVKYPNMKDFDKPENEGWVELLIQNPDANAIDFATDVTYRHAGILVFKIFVTLESGDAEVNKIADDLSSIFRGQAIDTTLFRAPNLERVGRVDMNEGAWFRKDLIIPFRWDARFNIHN